MFYPHLIYGISIWGGCGLTNINKIKNRQHKALRRINENDNSLSPLPLKSVYHFSILSKFQSIFHNGNSQYFLDKILSLTPEHQHHKRFVSFNKLNLPICQKTVYQNQFLYNAVKNWNELPPSLKNHSHPRYLRGSYKNNFTRLLIIIYMYVHSYVYVYVYVYTCASLKYTLQC